MKIRLQKFIICLLISCQIFYFISPLIAIAQDTSVEIEIGDGVSSYVDPSDPNGNFEATPLNEELDDPASTLPFATGPDNSSGNSLYNPSAVAEKQFPGQRVILNSTDKRKLKQTDVLYSALPDFYDEENLNELAAISGISYDLLVEYRLNNPTQFNQIVKTSTEHVSKDEYLLKRILKDPVILAKLFNSSEATMANEILKNPQDVQSAVQRAMETQIDQRIIKTLKYLVTPKDQGGAGHWQIKVERITQNHDKEFNKFENEDLAIKDQQNLQDNPQLGNTTIEQIRADENATATDVAQRLDDTSQAIAGIVDQSGETVATAFIGNGIDEDENTISAHYTGQAVDISAIDDIKCTVIGNTWLGPDVKKPQAPQPVKLQWQTTEGYNNDAANIDSSYNDMFMNASQSSITSMLSQLNFNFDSLGDMSGASLSDMTSLVAQAFMLSILNAPTDANVWNFSLGDTLRNLGGVIMADKLGLNRGPFLDSDINSIDGLSEGVGRNSVEEKLGLPYGALKGQTRNDLLATIGKGRILSELKLPNDILNYDIKDGDDLYQRIGSRKIEAEFGFNKGSFYGKSTLDEVKQSAGQYKMSAISALTSGVDQQLNLTSGTYGRFLSGSISPNDLNRLVAEAHFITFVANYQNYRHSPASDYIPTIDLPSGQVSNLRDDMFNLPKGKIDRFLNGGLTNDDLIEIGKYSVANTLETNDVNRARLTAWLNTPNETMTVPVTTTDASGATTTDNMTISYLTYASRMGVTDKDIYRIFGQNSAQAVFKRLGEQLLSQALKQTNIYTEAQNNFMTTVGQVETASQLLGFYTARITSISNMSSNYQNHVRDLNNQLNSTSGEIINDQTKQNIRNSMAVLSAAVSNASNASSAAAIIGMGQQIFDNTNQLYPILTNIAQEIGGNTGSNIANLTHAINAIQYDTETIAKYAFEINTGQEQADFRFGDLSIGSLQSLNLTFGNGSFSNSDFALLFAGKIGLKEFLLSAGSAQLASSFNLPKWALKYAASVVDNFINDGTVDIKDAFFRAIGISALESESALNSGSLAASNALGKAISFNDFRQIVRDKQNISQTTADAIIAESLNLKGYNLSSLMSGDFAAWSTARDKTDEFDRQNGLDQGTTEKFIKGSALGEIDGSTISSDEIRQTATAMHISEASIETFVAVMNGEENPAINKIYYVDNNRYSSSSAPSTSGVCAQPEIPDGSYVYYDQDGLHTFNSEALANEYRKAHSDRELNYIDEIANSLGFAISNSALTENPAHDTAVTLQRDLGGKMKASLESFLASQQAKPFDDDSFARLSFLMQTNYNLPSTVFSKAFARSSIGGTIDPSAQLDYLKILGYNVIKSSAMVQINDYLGFDFGSSRVTPDDLFNIMNGNGRETLARIGGTLLEQEMGLSTGIVQSILNSNSDDQRQCYLQNAALNLIGNLVGSRGMRLAGSLLDAFGGHRVEDYLGLPHDSFKGKDINELLASVPVEDLARAFAVPYSKNLVDAANYELRKMGSDYYADNVNKSFYDKMGIIESYIYGLGIDAPTVNTELTDGFQGIRRELTNIFLNVLSDSNLYSSDPNISLATLKNESSFSDTSDKNAKIVLSAFLSRVGATDGAFNLDRGTTAQLLSGKLSADSYRSKVDKTILIDGVGNYIISALGLDGTGITMERFNRFFAAIRNMGSDNVNTSTKATDGASDRVTVYNFLSDLFSINLDSKAGFTEGTFAQIIARPWQANSILLNEGIRKIDASLGRLDQPLSLQGILDIFINTSPADQTACDNPSVESFSTCINTLRLDHVVDLVKEQASLSAAGQIADWITEITNVKVTVDVPGGTTERDEFGIEMSPNDLLGIFHGDYRTLLFVGTVKGLAAIIGDKDGRLAVDPKFVLNYEDFFFAIFGNPELEDYGRTRAWDSTFAAANGSPPSSDDTNGTLVNRSPAANSTPNALTAPPPPSVTDETRTDLDNAWPVPVGANTAPPVFPGAMPPIPSTADKTPDQINQDYSAWYVEYMDWSNRTAHYASTMQTAYIAGEQAASQAQSSFTKNLEYKTIDCMLNKLDKDIPPGFAKAMLSGDNSNMVGGVIAYLANKLLGNSSIGDAIPPAIRNNLISYLLGEMNSEDFVSSVKEAGIDLIDNWLANNSPSLFGVPLFQPGMFKGIVALIKSGNFNTDEIISGIAFGALNKKFGTTSIASIIGNWVDNQIGLPKGVTFAIYTYLTNREASWLELAGMLLPEKYANFLEKATKYYELYKTGGIGGIGDVANYVFGKVGNWLDEKFGIPPGTLQHLFAFLLTGDPQELIKFFVNLLFGVHSTDVVCTADGYYPTMEAKPDPEKWDVANLGNFNAENADMRKEGYIKAAQYKAGQLAFDLLAMKDRTGDADLVPTQIMTARVEDVGPNATLVEETICDKVGSGSVQDNTAVCSGWRSRAGLWANPQTTAWTHIGF